MIVSRAAFGQGKFAIMVLKKDFQKGIDQKNPDFCFSSRIRRTRNAGPTSLHGKDWLKPQVMKCVHF